MLISYYAVFNYNEYDKCEKMNGISIYFPDIPLAISCARNTTHAMEMAQECLQLAILKDNGMWPAANELPPVTPLEEINLEDHEKAFLISFDTEKIDFSDWKFYDENNNSMTHDEYRTKYGNVK